MKKFENKHFVVVNGDPREAFSEIVKWGEASWWPKRSLMQFTRKTEWPIKVGTRYLQKVLLPLAPKWDVEVTELSGNKIARKFLNGMFSGEESVTLEKKGRTLEISYVMNYSVNGAVNKLLWRLIFKRMHDENIEAILGNLKKYLERN